MQVTFPSQPLTLLPQPPTCLSQPYSCGNIPNSEVALLTVGEKRFLQYSSNLRAAWLVLLEGLLDGEYCLSSGWLAETETETVQVSETAGHGRYSDVQLPRFRLVSR
jgi:hypothetical protein